MVGNSSDSPGPRTMTTVQCSECKKETQVPFQPTAGRPVYCRECFEKVRNRAGGAGGRGGGGFGGGRGRRPGATQAQKKTWTREDYPGYKNLL
ncbi:MAG: CxxC-x17-CxxC domain-containing protein [Methanobacteriota archaeon]